MSRVKFGAELGFDIYDENGLLRSSQLAGTAAPGGDAGPQDASPLGSIYQRDNGEFYVKTANVGAASDWALVPVELSGGYTPANGDPASGDSLEEAIQKLDANQDDLQTASGLAQGDVDYGTFTGNILSDNNDAKGLFQELETYVENIEGGAPVLASNVTTLQDIDTLLVDDIHGAEWEVVAWEEATPANKIFQKITALHNGTAAADATLADSTVHTKLKVGSNFNLVFEVDVNGAGAAQEMRLRASSSTAGVAMEIRRTAILVNS